MKFVRRLDLDPQTRIHIVMLAWLNQGVYGKMTQIAQYYRISRTFLSQLLFAATLQLETLFSDEQHLLQKDQWHVEPLILLLRLEGKCSIPSISSIVKYLGHQPNSVGSLSECFQRYGRALPSTVAMASKTVVFYLSDEIFASHVPILVTIDAQSTTILNIELASDRSAETWRAHCEKLEEHLFHSIGMASDRGLGLVAGYRAACQEALWVCDYFHEFQDLFNLLHQLERKAYAAISKEDEAAKKFDHAKSESNLSKRLHQYEQAYQACEQAMAIYDQLAILLSLLRETLQLSSPQGRLRTVEGVRAELTLLLHMIEEIDCPAITKVLTPIKAHIDDLLVPFEQGEAIYSQLLEVVPHNALDALVLAWHHDHFCYQSQAKHKHYHQRERDEWLACAAGLLDEAFEPLTTLVFEQIDSIIRASSLVEMVNSLLRPSLNSCKGHITQEALNLIMFYHNHRRYKNGKRKGKAPIELLTGETLESDWVELLRQQVYREQDAPLNVSLPSRAPMQLRPTPHGGMEPSAALAGPAILDIAASETLQQQPVAEAA
jgi:hypothetical protein